MIRKAIGTALVVAGLLGIVGARVYHFSAHPEWTEAQMVWHTWKVALPCAAVALLGTALMYEREE